MPTLEIGSHRIAYAIIRSKSRHYTYFKFRPDLTLEIAIPPGRGLDLDSAVRSREAWILDEYERMAKKHRILDGERVMFDGKYLTIDFQEDSEKEEIEPNPEGGRIVIRTSDRSRVGELVRRWFLKETSRYVVRKASELSLKLGVKYQSVDVREIQNWGYCTRNGRLSFSWQLIALPERLKEYVVLHELAHLTAFDHSPAFKRRLAAICTDYKQMERELTQILPYR